MAVERAIHPIHAGSRRAATAARVSHNAQPGRSGARHRESHRARHRESHRARHRESHGQ
jgi:hypothetical protein